MNPAMTTEPKLPSSWFAVALKWARVTVYVVTGKKALADLQHRYTRPIWVTWPEWKAWAAAVEDAKTPEEREQRLQEGLRYFADRAGVAIEPGRS